MTSRLGIATILAILAVYTLAQWLYVSGTEIAPVAALSYNLGAFSVICMAAAILLSLRPRAVEDYFGGLDRMYQVHKWLGIGALAFFLIHFATSLGGGADEAAELAGLPEPEEDGSGPIGAIGAFAMLGFTLLILVTLNRKIPYHIWIKTHLLTGAFFALACLHVWLVFKKGDTIPLASAPGLIIVLALLAGLLGYLYKQTLFRRSQRHAFTLDAVVAMDRATEIVLAPKTERFGFAPGQFAFLKIHSKGFAEYHPFTISSGVHDPKLRFTMKVLGDYTRRVRDHLTAGAEVLVEGPYGRFTPLDGPKRQVWLAGGIGITPFLSVLRSLTPGHGFEIHLFFCVRDRDEALYLDEIGRQAEAVGGVHLHLIASNDGGRLTAERVTGAVGDAPEAFSYYFCGPRAMLTGLRAGLIAKGVQRSAFHFEEFEMR